MTSSPNPPKFSPPSLPATIPRSRLFKRLRHHPDKSLIIILGQAAQGKSTLAASYLHHIGVKPAWINLAVVDSDPVNLFHCLVSSLESTGNGIDSSALRDYPAMSAGPRDESVLYRDWAHAIYSTVHTPQHIVLDGLDRLEAGASTSGFLAALIEEKPQHVYLWFLTRTAAHFQLDKLKLSHNPFILKNEDLAFTKPEIKSYFQHVKKLSLTAERLNRIRDLTEGWIGGLILLSENLERLHGEAGSLPPPGGGSARFKADAFQYFAEEIFASQLRSTQRFLKISSLFETIDPSIANRVAEIDNAETILADMVQRNLFVTSLYDERRGWVFRYHQLFRDFLQAKFRSEVAENHKIELWERAGRVCEDHGELELAATFYLRSRKYREATAAIEQIGVNLIKMGRTADLANFLGTLPKEIIRENPWLLLYSAVSKRFTNAGENTLLLEKAFNLFKSHRSNAGRLLALGFLIEASNYRGHDSVPMAVLLEEGETLLETIGVENYPWESASLWYQLGLAYILRGGDQRKGVQYCKNAYVLSRSVGNLPLQISALTFAIFGVSFLGEFALGDEFTQKIEALLEHSPYGELHALHLINYSHLCTIRGDIQDAGVLISEAREIIENHGLLYMYPVLFLTDLMVKAHLREFKEAEIVAGQALELSSALGMRFLKGVVLMFAGLNAYLAEDYFTARLHIEQSCEIVSSDESYSDTHVVWNRTLMGLVHYHEGRFAKAEILLKTALDHFTEISSPLTIAIGHLALALVKWKQRQVEAAATHLDKGLTTAEENGFYHFSFMNRSDMVAVCLLAVQMDLPHTGAYVVRLLDTGLAPLAMDDLQKLSQHSSRNIKKNARNILKSLYRRGLPKFRIEALNGFRVWRGDEVLPENDWGGNLPKLLLKTIVARGARNIPKDLLMEDLWPDENKTKSQRNFKVNLHRLRKLLEPSMKTEFGSSYIHLKDNLISLDSELWRLDTEEFSDRVKTAETAEGRGDLKKAIACLNEAMKIYRHDFMADDLYAEAIRTAREAFRQKFMSMLFKLANLYEKKGSLQKAASIFQKILDNDPISETACQGLMRNCANRGKRNDAIRIYEKFRSTLKDQADSEPDQLTSSVYRKILQTDRRQ